ncbi:MAG: carboxypeptidase regulatory-like domain-containing protein [Alphaproteobacteria bacterium]|nr:carboxypeptidase regulatory-like domain-containing protein [Alphaproteobacteria bacterium]
MRLSAIISVAALLAVGCGDKDSDDSAADDSSADDSAADDSSADDTASDDTGSEGQCGMQLDADAQLSGTVRDASGSPVAGAQVQLCWKVCRQEISGSDGGFSFSAAEPWTHALKIYPEGWVGGSTAVFMLPMTLAAGGNSIDVVLPEFTAWATIPASTPAELDLDGLLVTTSLAELDLGFGVDTDQAGGVHVPESDWPADWMLPAEATGTVVGAWYTHPYGAIAEGGMPTRVVDPGGDATSYQLWEAFWHVETCEVVWENAGSLTANGDHLEGDAALHEFTTVLLLAQ